MAQYRVRWEIDVDGETPREAAGAARKIMLDPFSTATVFNVEVGENEEEIIDLEVAEDEYKEEQSHA